MNNINSQKHFTVKPNKILILKALSLVILLLFITMSPEKTTSTLVSRIRYAKHASVPSFYLSSSVFSSFLCVFLVSFWNPNRFPMRCCCYCYGYSNFWSLTYQHDYYASVQGETSFYVCKKQTSNSLSPSF